MHHRKKNAWESEVLKTINGKKKKKMHGKRIFFKEKEEG